MGGGGTLGKEKGEKIGKIYMLLQGKILQGNRKMYDCQKEKEKLSISAEKFCTTYDNQNKRRKNMLEN